MLCGVGAVCAGAGSAARGVAADPRAGWPPRGLGDRAGPGGDAARRVLAHGASGLAGAAAVRAAAAGLSRRRLAPASVRYPIDVLTAGAEPAVSASHAAITLLTSLSSFRWRAVLVPRRGTGCWAAARRSRRRRRGAATCSQNS